MESKRKQAQEWLTEDGLLLLKCWARDGLSAIDIANNIGVSRKAIYNWMEKYPEINDAIRGESRQLADYRVENALYKRCIGCTITETTTYVSAPDKSGNRKTRTETLVKEIMPDVTACLAWLNNRQPTKWKRNRDNFISAEENNMGKVTINIVKDEKNKNITAEYESDEEKWEAEWNEAEEESEV